LFNKTAYIKNLKLELNSTFKLDMYVGVTTNVFKRKNTESVTRVTDRGGGRLVPTKIRDVLQLSAKFLKILWLTLIETGFLSFLRLFFLEKVK